MTKEEYLSMYKEDKLAEICAKFEDEMNRYHDNWIQCQDDTYKAQKKADEYEAIWSDSEQLFNKITRLPAKDFIELYYQMKEVIENKATNKNTTYISDPNNWGSITTAISGR